MAIGLHELQQSSERIAVALRSPILRVFAILSAIEALMVLALPPMASDTVASMLGDPILGVFSIEANVFRLIGLMLGLMFIDLLRSSMWAAVRRVAVLGESLTTGGVLRASFRRIGALLVTQQVIGVFVFLVSGICFVIGVSIQTFPHVLVTFTLAPALYAVVALERPIGQSLSQAARITRHNAVAVFGIQGLLLAMAYWIAEYFQGANIAPFIASYGAVALLVCYRFATFFGMSTLYVALEEAGEFEC